jgi:catechol-2,3-dioxygenase
MDVVTTQTQAYGIAPPSYRLPAATHVGAVRLQVADLDRSVAYYHAALGFDKVVWSYPGALFMSAGGYHHHLGTNTWAAGAPPARDDEARLLSWDLVLPDATSVDEAVRSLAAAARDGRGRGQAGARSLGHRGASAGPLTRNVTGTVPETSADDAVSATLAETAPL